MDYAGGTEPLRERYGAGDATKFDLLLDMVGGDALEFAAAQLLRPGAAIAHIQNAGSNPAANERHRAAAAAGTGPRWSVITCRPSGAQLAEIGKLLASGAVRLNIGHKLPVDQARDWPASPPPSLQTATQRTRRPPALPRMCCAAQRVGENRWREL